MGLGETNYPIMKKVILNGIECQAFVDPGCHKSLLDERIFEALDKRKVKTEPSLAKIKPIGRDSKVIPTSVKVVSDVTIFEGNNSRKVSWEFLVVPGLGFDIILGWDILFQYYLFEWAEKSSVPEDLAADMAERSSVHGILTADRAEKSSVPEDLVADMAERSSVHGILTADRAEKSSVPEELAADMAERSSVHGILTADRAEN
ncbi:hypothetical protein QYM36_016075, partial [Artemia franciscana]